MESETEDKRPPWLQAFHMLLEAIIALAILGGGLYLLVTKT